MRLDHLLSRELLNDVVADSTGTARGSEYGAEPVPVRKGERAMRASHLHSDVGASRTSTEPGGLGDLIAAPRALPAAWRKAHRAAYC